MLDEPSVPSWVVDALTLVLPAFNKFIREDSLSMGGGTVLQARWQHRESTDIDLFLSSAEFNSVIRESRESLEKAIYEIPGISLERSWVATNVVYCDVNGRELTLLPSDSLIDDTSGRAVPNTRVNTEATATILFKKVQKRMIEGGAFEIRDLFDLYTSIERDPEALNHVLKFISRSDLEVLVTTLRRLPDQWFAETTQPLKGVRETRSTSQMIERLANYFELI